jgi:hypothetical protein
MGTSIAVATETERLTNLATNEDRTPEARITAARGLLRHTRFADRSVRLAKKLAKFYSENQDVSASVRVKAARLFMFAVEQKVDEVEEAAEKEAEVAQATTDASLPHRNEPHFSRLITEYSMDKEAQQREIDALVAESTAKWNALGQPTFQKVVKDEKNSWWEMTPNYVQAIKEHGQALNAIQTKYDLNWDRNGNPVMGPLEAANVSN